MTRRDPLGALRAELGKQFGIQVSARLHEGSVVLEGNLEAWDDKVAAGYLAAGRGFRQVVNDIVVPGCPEEEPDPPVEFDASLEGRSFDVVVIGGGVIGSATARELSRYDLRVILLEKEDDLAIHASSRNDGMIHPGFAPSPGSKKAHYNIRGNRLYGALAEELGIEFRRVGSMILFRSPLYRLLSPVLKARARKNGVDGFEIWSRARVRREEPNAPRRQYGALYLPSAGIIAPYRLVNALAGHAVQNGAELHLGTQVIGFDMDQRRITGVQTNRGTIRARVVVNAAGVWSDRVAGFADDRFFSIHGRKGVDIILDKRTGKYQRHIASLPKLLSVGRKTKTKGGGLVPTVEGNLLIGPNAHETHERETYATDPRDIEELTDRFGLNRRIGLRDVITYFAGIRACTWDDDFIIERSEKVANLVHAAGIQSPGLASAPAIAQDLVRFCVDALGGDVAENPAHDKIYHGTRKSREGSAYNRVLCRCEGVSEGEVREALDSPTASFTLDGIKRRTRAGMGRCHGGFCTPRLLAILAERAGGSAVGIGKDGNRSPVILGTTKKDANYKLSAERLAARLKEAKG